MSTPIVATGAAALSFYVWIRRWQQCGYAGVSDLPVPLETHARTEQPPTTWGETLYLFKEALRYMYQETFGRWHAIDLFFGLAYLSRRSTDEYPAADIAAAGQPMHDAQMQPQAAQELIQQLQEVKRYMLYCQGLKHHKPELQLKHWRITTGLEAHDVIKHSPTAGLLRPAYVIFRDREAQHIILCVRGTHSRSDMFTSLTGTVKPHHVVTPEGVALGYSHLGMLAAARWLLGQTKADLIQALQQHQGYQLRVVGHSMGGGTAAMLTMMMREKVPQLSSATAWAIACPACMTLDLAASCAPFVTTLVHGTDIVPTFSSGAIDRLRDEVTQSSWFAEFQGDVSQRLSANFGATVRALRLGSAGEWTQRNIISTAATSFKSCYSKAPRSCYTRRSRAAATAAAASLDHPSPPVSPHAAAAPQHRSSWGFHIPMLASRRGRPPQPPQQPPPGGPAVLQLAQQGSSTDGAAAADDADAEDTALLARRQQQTSPSPFQWLRTMGSRGRRPGFAAAASRDGVFGRRSSSGAQDTQGTPLSSEAALVEHALQACLMAADCEQLQSLGTHPSHADAAGANSTMGMGGHAGAPAAPAAAAYAAGGSSSTGGRGAALASSFVKAASKVVLRTKRPAAPGKKSDDEPPLQQGRFDPTHQQLDGVTPHGGVVTLPPLASAGNSGAGGTAPQLPLSTGATSSASIHAAAAAGAGGASGVATETGGQSPSGGADGMAAASSSAGKPLPTSLRSRKGWAWGSMLGGDPGGSGWVTEQVATNRSSLTGGRRVVEYLGQTVGTTGRLMVETTGHLLRNSSNVLFQACTAPAGAHAAAAAAAAAGGGLGQQSQLAAAEQGVADEGLSQHGRHQRDGSSSGGGAGRSGIVVAPSSTDMERDGDSEDPDGPFVSALAASLAQEEDGDTTDSDSDLDLQEGPSYELNGEVGGASAFSLLDQPALRGNISALVAAVSSDAQSVGEKLARMQQEEDRAAEQLLEAIGVSSSEANIQRLALQHQQQQHGLSGSTAGAVSTGQQQHRLATAGGVLAPGNADSLRRESPMYPVGSMQAAARRSPSPSRLAGGSQAAEAPASSVDGDGGGGGGGRDKAAERLARRRMYPAGRVLHLMPRSACPPPGGVATDADSAGATADAAEGSGSSSFAAGRQLPPLTAALGSVGLGDEYVLLEVPRVEVYGRMKLCPAMVRDHFIPSYLKALESVLGQLQQAAAAEAE